MRLNQHVYLPLIPTISTLIENNTYDFIVFTSNHSSKRTIMLPHKEYNHLKLHHLKNFYIVFTVNHSSKAITVYHEEYHCYNT